MVEIEENEELAYSALVESKIVHWFVQIERLKSEVKIYYIG